jgi:hypothetical protein
VELSTVPASLFSSLASVAQCITVIKQQAEKSLNDLLRPSEFSRWSREKEVWESLPSVFLEPRTKYIYAVYFWVACFIAYVHTVMTICVRCVRMHVLVRVISNKTQIQLSELVFFTIVSAENC